MSTPAQITGLHFRDVPDPSGEDDGHVEVRVAFAGVVSTLEMSHKAAVIALADLLLVLAPDSDLTAALNPGTPGGRSLPPEVPTP